MWYGAGWGVLSPSFSDLVISVIRLTSPNCLEDSRKCCMCLEWRNSQLIQNSYSHAFLKHNFVFTMRNSIYIWHSNWRQMTIPENFVITWKVGMSDFRWYSESEALKAWNCIWDQSHWTDGEKQNKTRSRQEKRLSQGHVSGQRVPRTQCGGHFYSLWRPSQMPSSPGSTRPRPGWMSVTKLPDLTSSGSAYWHT